MLPLDVTKHVMSSPPTKYDTNRYGFDFELRVHAVPLLQTLSNDFILVVIPTSPSKWFEPQLVYNEHNKTFKTTARSNDELNDVSHQMWADTLEQHEFKQHEYRNVTLFWGELPLYARDLSIVLFHNSATCHYDLLQANFE